MRLFDSKVVLFVISKTYFALSILLTVYISLIGNSIRLCKIFEAAWGLGNFKVISTEFLV